MHSLRSASYADKATRFCQRNNEDGAGEYERLGAIAQKAERKWQSWADALAKPIEEKT
ncbi:hypothetical protein LCGC14_3088970 [marine sediment metagenome]|uniref:Uncharacterized protein n=1 Tax=marine sediment metagenome TaxID=412755 RepID=A0A0F8WZS2_9ZZZZ